MDSYDEQFGPTAPVHVPPPAPEMAQPTLSAPETMAASGGPSRRSRVGTGIALAAVGIGALGVVGTAYAANSGSTATATPSGAGHYGASGASGATGPHGSFQGRRPGGMRPGMGMGMGLGMGLGMGIHGTAVVQKKDGTFETIDAQQGKVTDVSQTSITVLSADKFSKKYVVTADTVVNAKRDGIGSVKDGDEVSVVGTESAGSTTANQIIDRTQISKNWGQWGGKNDQAPKPTPTTTA
jgi:hypothetical protein